MLGFPPSTEFNKRIPKQKFYENAAVPAAVKRLFADQLRCIYWRNKLAVSTLNLTAGERVTEIEIFELCLTGPKLDEAVLRQIDSEIPYHILFVLSYKNKSLKCCSGLALNTLHLPRLCPSTYFLTSSNVRFPIKASVSHLQYTDFTDIIA